MNVSQSAGVPIHRPAGRVILADALDRILLIRIEDHTIDNPFLWITPGGACEDSETPEQAAARELFEETGIVATRLGPCVLASPACLAMGRPND